MQNSHFIYYVTTHVNNTDLRHYILSDYQNRHMQTAYDIYTNNNQTLNNDFITNLINIQSVELRNQLLQQYFLYHGNRSAAYNNIRESPIFFNFPNPLHNYQNRNVGRQSSINNNSNTNSNTNTNIHREPEIFITSTITRHQLPRQVPVTTSQREFAAIQSITFSQIRTNNPTEHNVLCTICRDEFVDTDVLKMMTCGHYYHIECLRSWLSRSQTCPLCRTSTQQSQQPIQTETFQRQMPNGNDQYNDDYIDTEEMDSDTNYETEITISNLNNTIGNTNPNITTNVTNAENRLQEIIRSTNVEDIVTGLVRTMLGMSQLASNTTSNATSNATQN